jgi:hypothetical protein
MQSQDTLFRKAMALAAYDMSYKHLLNYEKLWGEEEDIELGNQALRAIEDALGTAIEESFEDWWAYSQKATYQEISLKNVSELLKRIKPASDITAETLASNDPLYFCLAESCIGQDSWRDILDMDHQSIGEQFTFFTTENLTTDAGWDQFEADRLAALDVGQGVFDYGTSRHTIIRIR